MVYVVSCRSAEFARKLDVQLFLFPSFDQSFNWKSAPFSIRDIVSATEVISVIIGYVCGQNFIVGSRL